MAESRLGQDQFARRYKTEVCEGGKRTKEIETSQDRGRQQPWMGPPSNLDQVTSGRDADRLPHLVE